MITSGKYGLFISVLKFVFRQLLKDKKFSGCFILKEVIFFTTVILTFQIYLHYSEGCKDHRRSW